MGARTSTLGDMRGQALLDWLSALPVETRDSALEEHLGIAEPAPDSSPPGPELIGYHASSVAAIVRALIEIPVVREDIFVDLGAGLGKVVLLAHLLTGASARGIELQPELVARAAAAASRLAAEVKFVATDARDADLDSGTVFYLYAPFTGSVLSQVLRRLESIATRRAIVICGLGVDLHRAAPWLGPRPTDSFWLTVYDSVVAGVSPRSARHSALEGSTDIVTRERV